MPQDLLNDIQPAPSGCEHPHAAAMRTHFIALVPLEDQGGQLCAMSSLRVSWVCVSLPASLPQIYEPVKKDAL